MILNKRLSFALCMLLTPGLLSAQIAVKGKTVYTMAGKSIENGVVLIKDGKIDKIGTASQVKIPRGFRIVEGEVVTPGLIDAHSVVGLAGIYNQHHDQDQLDKSDAIQPELRAMDAYNPREKLVEWVRGLGVTTLHSGHAPGGLITGQSLIVKTAGNTLAEVLVDSSAMLTMTLGASVGSNFKKPGTRAKGMAMLRQECIKARDYLEKQASEDPEKRPARDLNMEAMAELLSGKKPALITAQRVTEILGAIRLSQEFGFRLILDGAAESYMVLDEIRQAGVPVILHPTMVRSSGDTRNATYETAAKLKAAGIPFAFQSGYESYVPKTRVVLYEAAIACANGLSFEDALAALTIEPARILGIEHRVGSLENGKDADLVVYDGDPFEYTSHVCTVIANGALVSEECR